MRIVSRALSHPYSLAAALLGLAAGATAQTGDTLRGVCGTVDFDIERTRANIAASRSETLAGRGNEITYVPLRYTLVGESDGTGAAGVHDVLDMTSSANADFAPVGFRFFLDEVAGTPFEYLYNSDIYERHIDFAEELKDRKAPGAVNVFVPATANTGSTGTGVTLGYYTQNRDYLVFRQTEVGPDAATASHEFGHFFSLPHTFFGWECGRWRGTTFTDDPDDAGAIDTLFEGQVTRRRTDWCGRNRLIELVDRGEGGNCDMAGDLFCDTEANYKFGFGAGACAYSTPILDRVGDTVRPDVDNFMSYFQSCDAYVFSDQQAAAMRADLASERRSFLRGRLPAVTDSLGAPAVLAFPADGTTTDFSDVVELAWDSVANAQYYFVEVAERRSFSASALLVSAIVNAPTYTLTDLDSDVEYFVRIRAFSQVDGGEIGPRTSFITGQELSTTRNLTEAATGLQLYPSPSGSGDQLVLSFAAESSGEYLLVISDLTGRRLADRAVTASGGRQRVDVTDLRPSVPGTYALTVASVDGYSTRKFVVR